MLDRTLMPPNPDELIIYVNGDFLPDSRATISTLDHGLVYGDGCFDAWCGRNGFIYQLDAHLDRLYRSVEGLKIRNLRVPKEEMRRRSSRRSTATPWSTSMSRSWSLAVPARTQ